MRAIIAAILLIVASAALAEPPKLIGRVNDHANVLTSEQRAALERKLEAIEQTEGRPQVAVLLPATMDGADIERFSNDTFRAWKLGQAGKDNGVLIVIAPKERKWRIEVGYGLEGIIPDSRAKSIIANDMDPHLKGGKTGFYAALDAAASSVAAEIAKERPTPAAPTESSGLWLLAIPVVGGGLLVILFASLSGRRERREQEARAARPAYSPHRSYEPNPMGAAIVGAAIGGGMGAGIAAASLSRPHHAETPKPKRRVDDEPRRSYSSSSSSDSSSSSSNYSSSSSDSGSSSFSGGGGDSGGGGASGGD